MQTPTDTRRAASSADSTGSNPPASSPTKSSRARGALIWRGLAGLAILLALLLLAQRAGGYVPAFAEWVGELGIWGALIFVLGYAVATVAFIPGSLLTLAGGAIFGIAKGTMLVFVGTTLGATLAFLIARYVARGAIERRVADHPRFVAVDRAVEKEGLKIVFLLRLSPVFPFVLLNYGLGLTRVRFVDLVIASIGMLPGSLLYVYYGKLAGDVATLASGSQAARGWEHYVVLGLGVLATLAVTAVVTTRAQRILLNIESEPLTPRA